MNQTTASVSWPKISPNLNSSAYHVVYAASWLGPDPLQQLHRPSFFSIIKCVTRGRTIGKQMPKNKTIWVPIYEYVWAEKEENREARQKVFSGLKDGWRAVQWLAVQLGDAGSQLAKWFNWELMRMNVCLYSLSPSSFLLASADSPHYIYLLTLTPLNIMLHRA